MGTNSHRNAMKHFLYWLFGYRRVSLDGTVSYTWGRRVYVVPKNGAADGSGSGTEYVNGQPSQPGDQEP